MIDSLDAFATQFHEWLEAEKSPAVDQVQDAGLDAFFAANTYLKIAELYDDAFETRVARTGDDITVKQMCLNPSEFVDARLALGHGAVLFSATLTPMNYYQDVLGGVENSLAYTLPSPFPPANQAVVIASNVQTTYRERTRSLPALIAALTVLVTARAGHYLVFCPSYAYLQTVHDAFVRANPKLDVVTQRSAMSAAERQGFLDAFAPGQPPVVASLSSGVALPRVSTCGGRRSLALPSCRWASRGCPAKLTGSKITTNNVTARALPTPTSCPG